MTPNADTTQGGVVTGCRILGTKGWTQSIAWLALLGFSWCVVGCGGDALSHTGPSAMQNGVTLEITAADGAVFPMSGEYHYQLSWRVENSGSTAIVFEISPTFYDATGRRLSDIPTIGITSGFVSPLGSRRNTLNLYDRTLSNPWAERAVVRVSYHRADGGPDSTLVASYPVTHGPVVARLHDFSVTPSDPAAGQPVTIKWNVSNATRVQLSTWVFDPSKAAVVPLTDVAPVGTVTVVPLPYRSVGLKIDDWSPQIREINIRP